VRLSKHAGKAIAHRHQADLTAAKRKYDQTHKSKP
jgi:hypothetical protein